jgi:hypothetical protein
VKGEEMKDEGGGASRTTDSAAGTSPATDVSLREYLFAAITESRRECRDNIAHLERHFDEVTDHAEETMEEFRKDVSRRFDGVNEFRDALSDLSRLMATKDNLSRVEEKFEANLAAQAARVTMVERRIDLREGQTTGTRVTMGNLVVAITVAVSVIGLIVTAIAFLGTR